MTGKQEGNKKWYSDKDSFCIWLRGPSFALYLNYFLSSWGDRMWHFAVALYLVHLSDGMLRLAAIFGFTGGILMLIFGGIIGDWVDRNGRIKVVTISLFVQNISVALCAVSVCMALKFELEIAARSLGPLLEGIIIGLALVAYLASMAYKIAIEKDWIVVVAAGNRGQLSNLNAVTRAIDLSCKILAPTVAGIIMSYSHIIASVVIAVWNIVSVFLEYLLLRRVYSLVPALAIKGSTSDDDVKECEMQDLAKAQKSETEALNKDKVDEPKDEDTSDNSTQNTKERGEESELLNSEKSVKVSIDDVADEKKKKKKTCVQLATEPFVTLAKGWKTYARQRVVFAGLALSLLYMTVLGFDSVTTGYIYANGVKESYVGISMAAAGLTGIIGTFVFTRINKRLGLERTGLIAFSIEVLCLMLTLFSVWAPGTRFDPFFTRAQPNCTLAGANDTSMPLVNTNNLRDIGQYEEDLHDPGREKATDVRYRRDLGHVYEASDFVIPALESQMKHDVYIFGVDGMPNQIPVSWSQDPRLQIRHRSFQAARSRRDVKNTTYSGTPATPPASPGYKVEELQGGGNSNLDCTIPDRPTTSIVMFLVGIVTSRIGLWMADLVITQLLQENVVELERGIVNGVQNSLNMLNDMIKFALVIVLPKIETFGILIVLSFAFICMAGFLFFVHVWKTNRPILQCGRGTDDKQKKHIVTAPDEKVPTVDV